MRKYTILLIVFLVLVFADECISAQKSEYIYSMPIPKDFSVVAVAGGVHPKYPLYKADIGATGSGVYSQMLEDNRKKGLFVEVGRFQLDEQALRAIFVAIKENDFFNLRAEYMAPDVLDGTLAELIVTENGRTYAVWTRNIAVKRFDNIMMVINMALPPGNKVMYNEILRPKGAK